MKLEDQVCSLELSKKLKELGLNQDTYWYWGNLATQDDFQLLPHHAGIGISTKTFAAFTVAELGEMLPSVITDKNEGFVLDQAKSRQIVGGYALLYRNHGNILHSIVADTEANARAKMLCYLLENKLITL